METDKPILNGFKRIFSRTIGQNFELKKILQELRVNLNIVAENTEHQKNVIIISFLAPNSDKNIFIFNYGVVLLWAFEEEEEKEIISFFYKNCKYVINQNNNNIFNHYNYNHSKTRNDNKNPGSKTNNALGADIKNSNNQKVENSDTTQEFFYPYSDTNGNIFHFKKGEIFGISSKNRITIESNDISERLTVAFAIAQETILRHYEMDVHKVIDETKRIPIDMRDKGEINLNKKEISRNIGIIFMRRSAINLNSDILDTPDIFWNQKTELEEFYKIIRRFLDINKRVEILNKRMKILKELYDVMNNEIKTQGKFRLEWIVVYLIVIEIFVSLFWKILVKDIMRLF